ncbi:YfjD family protein [Bacillus halotolerans]|uniref:YfjD family protein n=1 Tax=Bacillus halotolerans TaxID=260554 RepID=A0A9Q4EPI5_9BACI|nr:YfjD family protein [Bacillus halotolerans]MCY9185758.1 YfjD family protein [Bacillus halotolerans]MCY9199105.1 YfjD family protein [Bacillus halotolerans]
MENQVVEVKSRMFLRIWAFVGSAGMGLACLWLFYMGITFQTKYYLLAIPAGFLFTLFCLYLFIIFFPAFTPRGNIIFRIKTGKDGEIFTDKAAVKFADIKKIEMNRNKYRLIGIFQEDVIIQTTDHKTIRIPTWNIIPNPLFFEAVERYIVPHMNDEAKTNWIGQFTEIQRNVYLKEFENHPKL